MRKLLVLLTFVSACAIDAAHIGETAQEDNSSWPWCGGTPGECTVGGPTGVPVCRAICNDPGGPFTSGCANWEVPGLPPGSVGRCYMGPK